MFSGYTILEYIVLGSSFVFDHSHVSCIVVKMGTENAVKLFDPLLTIAARNIHRILMKLINRINI